MIKNVLFLFIGLSMITLSYGQTTDTKVVGNAEELKSIPQLTDLAIRVNTTYAVYQHSSTATRTAATAAKTDYESALAAYLTELELQITKKSNATNTNVIQAEIDLVKRLQTNLINPSTK